MTSIPSFPSSQTRPVLVHLSPLPVSRNGIADYAAAILQRLSRRYQCICVVEDTTEVSHAIRHFAHVISHDDYDHLYPELANERHLAHIGNNEDHVRILSALGRVPGVAVVHDLTLHYLLERWTHAAFADVQHTAETMRAIHDPRVAELAERRYKSGVPLQSIYAEANGLPILSSCAHAAITHSQLGQVMLRAAGFGGPVKVVPHFADLPRVDEAARRRRRFRGQLGIPSDTVLLSSLGFVSPNKQITAALEALASLPDEVPDWHYVIAGENRDPSVAEVCDRLGLEDRVTFLDYVEDETFKALLDASELCINLRYPTSGETSGTVSRALAHGVPVLVHHHGWYSELPETLAYQVSPAPGMTPELRMQLIRAICDADERREKAEAARKFARHHLDIDTIANSYCDIIEQTWADQGTLSLRRANEVAARRISGTAVLSFAPEAAIPSGDADLPTVIAAILQGEHASVAGTLLPARCLPSASCADQTFSQLTAHAAPLDLPAESPAQAFLVLEDNGTMAALNLPLQDAGSQLRDGDLLSVALVSDNPDGTGSQPSTGLPDDPSLWTLEERLHRSILQAGFSMFRTGTRHVVLPEAGFDYRRILICTCRRVSRPSGDAGFSMRP